MNREQFDKLLENMRAELRSDRYVILLENAITLLLEEVSTDIEVVKDIFEQIGLTDTEIEYLGLNQYIE